MNPPEQLAGRVAPALDQRQRLAELGFGAAEQALEPMERKNGCGQAGTQHPARCGDAG